MFHAQKRRLTAEPLSVRVSVCLDEVGEKIPSHVRGTDAQALVEAVDTIPIGVSPETGDAVDRNADGLEEDAVGGAGRHGRHERHAPIVPGHELLGRPDDLWIEGWWYGERPHGRHRRHPSIQ